MAMHVIRGPGAGLFFILASAAAAAPLPFEDGRYVADPALCRLSEQGLFDTLGDDIYHMLVIIDGPLLNEGYGAFCDVDQVRMDGDTVRFTGSCEVEGAQNPVDFSYRFLSSRAFQIQNVTYTRCD